MRGAFLGLTWRHGKPHMVRAIMESIAYEYAFYLRAVREIAPGYDPRHAINIGGGARSGLLRQIKADTLGIDYHGLEREEFEPSDRRSSPAMRSASSPTSRRRPGALPARPSPPPAPAPK